MLSVTLETIMIARFAGTTNKAGIGMGVFFSFCFISFYGGGLDVVGYVYCSKSTPQPLEFHNNCFRRNISNAYTSSRRGVVPCRHIPIHFNLHRSRSDSIGEYQMGILYYFHCSDVY